MWALVVAMHRLSCSAACGIFLEQELNPCLLHWQTHCTTRKMPNKDLLVKEEEIFRPGVTIDTCYTWGREVRVSFGLLHIL